MKPEPPKIERLRHSEKQGRISTGGGHFFWLARIYNPVGRYLSIISHYLTLYCLALIFVHRFQNCLCVILLSAIDGMPAILKLKEILESLVKSTVSQLCLPGWHNHLEIWNKFQKRFCIFFLLIPGHYFQINL